MFSLGLDDLGERAARDGFDVEIVRGPNWRAAAIDEAVVRREAGTGGILIAGGHSYGADNAIRFCQWLETEGVDVDLLLLLDATSPPPVPANVIRCVHYYRPTIAGDLLPFLLAGQPVELADGNVRTKLVNVRLTPEVLGREANGVGHFNIDASDFIHNLCLEEMNRVYLDRSAGPNNGVRQAPTGDRG